MKHHPRTARLCAFLLTVVLTACSPLGRTGRSAPIGGHRLQHPGPGRRRMATDVHTHRGEWPAETADSSCRISAYDDTTVTDVAKATIDHMALLAEAWRSGADTLECSALSPMLDTCTN
ncbi:hypothetical protein [Streptomyces sp. AK02-04a]|uniref:hypothetical protein n=1 Tax=Streptomyces sp. AK02-04a TaxID=3028649 RepID=UPI0029ABD491|nr:hypothetical protein [Streptomyces sp. AK02-04a]MDX3763873.1 hypothetical protein [Streptomyces sp. AK02-04a]